MPKYDQRRLLAAFYEKGLILYDERERCGFVPDVDTPSPIDNILPGKYYRIVPEDTKEHVAAFLEHPDEGKVQLHSLKIEGGKGMFTPLLETLKFPVEELEEVVRNCVTAVNEEVWEQWRYGNDGRS